MPAVLSLVASFLCPKPLADDEPNSRASAPEKGSGNAGTNCLLTSDRPKLADLVFHLGGFATQHLKDQTSFIGQTAGAGRHAASQIHVSLHSRIDAMCC